ncbi:protein DCL homolog, chloroplastic-like [Mangifera indica]|uniref:protein DCL homolog, chloroplastic-like n=1 Tax=Mangifera indica TaxID=29780 RepID=UPI001CF96EF4|nr:protein DCL homolog, chloroplastic-like [Mangifera indica]
MATPLLLRGIPLLRLRLAATLLAPPRQTICSATASEPAHPDENVVSEDKTSAAVLSMKDPPKYNRGNDPDYRKWKDKEGEILRDIEPIMFLTKEIIHSDRYMDGERLTAEDERAVVEKLLAYHPHSEDKIGCGVDSIMVDRHPQYRHSRCLFVVRTDGGWIDFSYQKCLRAYIRDKYPSYAERFIREHFKRGSG